MQVKNSLFALSAFLFIGCGGTQYTGYPVEEKHSTPYRSPLECAMEGKCEPKPKSQLKPAPKINASSKRLQRMHKATMRPYTVWGKRYYPSTVSVGEVFEGIASWYGPKFHGNKTSSGEVYDMHGLTAAHKTLPMNTMVKVYNKRNKRSVIVRINDRGPFVEGRIIDLSFAAGKQVGLDISGTAPVEVEVLGFDRHVTPLKGDPTQKDRRLCRSNWCFPKRAGGSADSREESYALCALQGTC